MQYGDKWLGVLGGGFSASVIGGFSACQAVVWPMSGGNIPMNVLITGVRLGAVANADMGHYVVYISGVPRANSFSEIKSKGIDWTISLGTKGEAWLKGAGKVGDSLVKLSNAPGNWAAQEVTKKVVQGAMGDFELSPKEPAFILLPTPLSVGLGLGIFYEWQTLVKQGTDIAWKYMKPSWWVKEEDGHLVLHMSGIPAQENEQIPIHVMRKVVGYDDIFMFKSGTSLGASPKVLLGTVKGGRLYDKQGHEGISLTDHPIAGVMEIGMLTTPHKAKNFANETISIGIGVSTSFMGTNLYKWQSKDYAKVTVDGNGKFSKSTDWRIKL
jgi:hypothetical protein